MTGPTLHGRLATLRPPRPADQRAIACYQECGFCQEGVERESALIAGQWYSDVMMSNLEREYRAMRQEGRLQTGGGA